MSFHYKSNLWRLFICDQANIRAKKREELKAQLGSKIGAEQEDAAWFDARVAMRPSQRTKRALRFNEPGKFQQLADRIRMKVIYKCFCNIFMLIKF